MELLGDVGHVESRFGPFGDNVSVGARLVHGLCQMYHKHRKSFWTLLMALLGCEDQVEAHFSPFQDSAQLDARWVHGLRRTYHRLRNRFRHSGCSS
jgi:hypothetical protein